MRKRWMFSALAMILVLLTAGIWLARPATRVSAKEILERAYAAQNASTSKQGIEHIRSKIYYNLQALSQERGTDSIIERYLDLNGGNFRMVVSDAETGKIQGVYAYDGTYAYSLAGSRKALPATLKSVFTAAGKGGQARRLSSRTQAENCSSRRAATRT